MAKLKLALRVGYTDEEIAAFQIDQRVLDKLEDTVVSKEGIMLDVLDVSDDEPDCLLSRHLIYEEEEEEEEC